MAEGARHAWQCTRGAAFGGALHVLIALSPCAVIVQRPSPPLRSLGVFLGQLVSVSSRLRRVHLPLDLCTMHALTPRDLCHSIPAYGLPFFPKHVAYRRLSCVQPASTTFGLAHRTCLAHTLLPFPLFVPLAPRALSRSLPHTRRPHVGGIRTHTVPMCVKACGLCDHCHQPPAFGPPTASLPPPYAQPHVELPVICGQLPEWCFTSP